MRVAIRLGLLHIALNTLPLIAAAAAIVAAPRAPQILPFTELQPAATWRVGKTADWVAITGDAVWVGSTGENAVHRIDPQTNRVVADIALPGEPCAGLAIGFGSLWVPLCTQPTSLARVDLARNAITAVFKVAMAGAESGVATSADSVWLVADAKGTLLRIDPQGGTVRQSIHLPAGSWNPRFAAGAIWVTRAGGAEVIIVDATSGAITGSVQTGQNPRFLTDNSDSLWTLNQGDGSLSRIDMRTHQLLNTVALGTPGHGGDVSFGAGLVWTTMMKTPLSGIDAATNTLLCQWVGAGGDSLGIGHGAIWLTDYHAGTVARFDLAALASRCRAPKDSVVGTWRLLRYEDRPERGPTVYPYGEHPQGLLHYDASGYMSIQTMKSPHPKVASGDDDQVTPAEKIALYDAYVAYYGRYRVDADRKVVVTRAEGDLADVFVGREEERPFELQGDTLTLTPQWTSGGTHWQGLRVFERVHAPGVP